MSIESQIDSFNKSNAPFYIVSHDDGIFSLCLPLSFLGGEYENYCQEAFDAYAVQIGEPIFSGSGLPSYGNGYEWEAAFQEAFADDANIKKVTFDCEAGGFFCTSAEFSVLEDFGKRFKTICEDTEKFTAIIADGIEHAEERQMEKERLMRTVRGRLMWRPTASFDILTPSGLIHLTAEDNKRLLNGEQSFVKIGDVTYASEEFLDQMITNLQRDLFDHDLIKMTTEEAEPVMSQTMSM